MRTQALLIPALALLAAVPAAARSPIEGLWTNPKRSIVVRIGPCGPAYCGKVVQASEREEAKAARYGMDELEGEQMLTGLKPQGAGRWRGQVYVPKLKRRVGSTVVMENPRRMKVSGCFAGLLCKTQVWTRVG